MDGEEIPVVQWTHPQRGSLVETVPANGNLRPLVEIALSPDVSGEIVALYVREGDWVQQGDLLLKIRQDIYLSAVDQAEASLQAVQAQLRQERFQFEQHQRQYERSQMLYEQGSISKVEYEDAEAAYRLAECRLETAQHNVASATAMRNEARENLQKTLVYAPIEDTISRLSVEQGERVVGTSQMAGTEMLRIADFRQMEVRVDVNENDILKIRVGDSARVSVDAYPGRIFSGLVTHLANSARGYEQLSATTLPTFRIRVLLLPESYADLSWEEAFRPACLPASRLRPTDGTASSSCPCRALSNALTSNVLASLSVQIRDKSTSPKYGPASKICHTLRSLKAFPKQKKS